MKPHHLVSIPLLLLFSCTASPPEETHLKAAAQNNGREEPNQGAPRNLSRTGDDKPHHESLPAGRPNVILVLLDTVRPDYLGFYGFERKTAPFLFELAKSSAVFENALSTSSWTAPSVASLFTSLYPPEHSVVQGFRAQRGMISKLKQQGDVSLRMNRLPAEVTTLPELFKASGYRTFGLAANINIGDEIGFSRGFDQFEKHVKAPAQALYEKVAEWRDQIIGETPFFLYLHLNDAHSPYHLRKPFFIPAKSRKEDAAARYLSEIGYLDDYLQKTWAIPGLSKNTALVLVSDHGEEFWDHGSTEHGPTLYTELNHVLMMVHAPSQGIGARRIAQNVSLVDVLPTLAGLVGAGPKKGWEGLSLLPMMRSPEASAQLAERLDERCLFGHRMYSSKRKLAVWSVTCGAWKLIDWWGDRIKLFNHAEDPGEYYNLALKSPKMAAQLTERLKTFKDRMASGESASEKTEIALDGNLLEKLRGMGYIE